MYAKLYNLSCGLHAILKKRKKKKYLKSGTDNMTNKQQRERPLLSKLENNISIDEW